MSETSRTPKESEKLVSGATNGTKPPAQPAPAPDEHPAKPSTEVKVAPPRPPPSDPDQPARHARAARACRRCQQKKLRCFGGCPCTACKRARHTCDFRAEADSSRDDDAQMGTDSEVDTRFRQLEKLVQDLVSRIDSAGTAGTAGMAATGTTRQRQTNVPFAQHQAITSNGQNGHPAPAPAPPTFPGFSFTPADTRMPVPQLADPNMPTLPTDNPFPNATFVGEPAHSVSSNTSYHVVPPSNHSANSPEGRLAAYQSGTSYGAPLRTLAFNPAHWDNADRTRPPSPSREPVEQTSEFWTGFNVRPGMQDDPVTQGIIDQRTAQELVEFFFQYCQIFMPIFEFDQSSDPAGMISQSNRLEDIKNHGPYLFTAILAVAARSRPRPGQVPAIQPPTLDPDASLRLRQLAYAHFASSTFRRHQSLSDIQATLLLAGWGLHEGSEGPEAWMSTGHCGRLAHRLGLHTLGRSWTTKTVEGKSPAEIAKLISQWKTWLFWFCFDNSLELGFGRPPMIQVDPDEDSLLHIVESGLLSAESASSCLYLIGLTRLVKIGRELSRWTQHLDGKDESAKTLPQISPMLQQLNGKLDLWERSWTWNGSFFSLRLGRYTPLIKLQCQHFRLCLNSLALKAAFSEELQAPDSFMSSCLSGAAMAALDMIQAYVDGSSSSPYLVFCLDYICLTIGHALIFLVRLYVLQGPIPIDRSVILHYLESAIDLMETSDMAPNGQATHIARTCRDICRAGQIPLPQFEKAAAETAEQTVVPPVAFDYPMDSNLFGDVGNGEGFDLDWFLGLPTFGIVEDQGNFWTG